MLGYSLRMNTHCPIGLIDAEGTIERASDLSYIIALKEQT